MIIFLILNLTISHKPAYVESIGDDFCFMPRHTPRGS